MYLVRKFRITAQKRPGKYFLKMFCVYGSGNCATCKEIHPLNLDSSLQILKSIMNSMRLVFVIICGHWLEKTFRIEFDQFCVDDQMNHSAIELYKFGWIRTSSPENV